MEGNEELSSISSIPRHRDAPAGRAVPGLPAHSRPPARKGQRGPDRALPSRAPRKAGPQR